MREPRDSSGGEARTDDGISYRGVLVGAGIIAGAIAVSLVSAFALLHALHGRQSAPTAPLPGMARGPSSGPALQPNPANDIAAYRAEKQKQLTTYGWVDRAQGIVHIPIERAMELMARQPSNPGATP